MPQEQEYPRTAALYYALMRVESLTRLFIRELEAIGRDPRVSAPSVLRHYSQPPQASFSESLTARFNRFREEFRAREPEASEALDRYYGIERQWREGIHYGMLRASGAAAELDSRLSAPLDRTSTGIKRSLRRLYDCVGSSEIMGHTAIHHEEWVPALQRRRAEVGAWIDELRLLVVAAHLGKDAFFSQDPEIFVAKMKALDKPAQVAQRMDSTRPGVRSSSGNPRRRRGKKQAPAASRRKRDGPQLDPTDMRMLELLSDNDITRDDDTRWPAKTFVGKVPNLTLANARKHSVKLGKLRLIDVRTGWGGGCWITAAGLDRVRRHRDDTGSMLRSAMPHSS